MAKSFHPRTDALTQNHAFTPISVFRFMFIVVNTWLFLSRTAAAQTTDQQTYVVQFTYDGQPTAIQSLRLQTKEVASIDVMRSNPDYPFVCMPSLSQHHHVRATGLPRQNAWQHPINPHVNHHVNHQDITLSTYDIPTGIWFKQDEYCPAVPIIIMSDLARQIVYHDHSKRMRNKNDFAYAVGMCIHAEVSDACLEAADAITVEDDSPSSNIHRQANLHHHLLWHEQRAKVTAIDDFTHKACELKQLLLKKHFLLTQPKQQQRNHAADTDHQPKPTDLPSSDSTANWRREL